MSLLDAQIDCQIGSFFALKIGSFLKIGHYFTETYYLQMDSSELPVEFLIHEASSVELITVQHSTLPFFCLTQWEIWDPVVIIFSQLNWSHFLLPECALNLKIINAFDVIDSNKM